MSRVKTFQATGVAPDGRLYAGDLNAIQDQYADLTNFAQTVGLGVLQVGDTSLNLLKYGTGEVRMTGAARFDGILRGLGGLFAGAFSTAQRDAIPSGFAPFTIIIFNTTAGRFEWNAGTDAARRWISIGAAAGSGEAGDPGGGHYIGEMILWSGVNPPAFGAEVWVFADGAAVSRTTYATYLAKVRNRVTGTTTNGSAVITALATTAGMYPGQPVEGTGIPVGRTVASVNSGSQVTLSGTASASGTGVTLDFFPYGNGNGTTTFNIPDFRGRVPVGYAPAVGHADVLAMGLAEDGTMTGSAVANRRPRHKTGLVEAGHTHTATQPPHRHAPPQGGRYNNTQGIEGGIVNSGTAEGSNSYTDYQQPAITVATVVTGITGGPQTNSPVDSPASMTCAIVIRIA